jgi:hypothetical protein
VKRGRGHVDPYYMRALIDPKSSRIPAHRPPRVQRLNPPDARPEEPASRKPSPDREAAIDPPAKKSRAGGKQALSDAAVTAVIECMNSGHSLADAAQQVIDAGRYSKSVGALKRLYNRNHRRIRRTLAAAERISADTRKMSAPARSAPPEMSAFQRKSGPGQPKKT